MMHFFMKVLLWVGVGEIRILSTVAPEAPPTLSVRKNGLKITRRAVKGNTRPAHATINLFSRFPPRPEPAETLPVCHISTASPG
jgi:hypothetical protein